MELDQSYIEETLGKVRGFPMIPNGTASADGWQQKPAL